MLCFYVLCLSFLSRIVNFWKLLVSDPHFVWRRYWLQAVQHFHIVWYRHFSILCTKFNLFLRVLWKEACHKDEIFFQPGDGIYIAGYHLLSVVRFFVVSVYTHIGGIFKTQLNNIITVCCCLRNHYCQFGRKADHGRMKTLITK